MKGFSNVDIDTMVDALLHAAKGKRVIAEVYEKKRDAAKQHGDTRVGNTEEFFEDCREDLIFEAKYREQLVERLRAQKEVFKEIAP